MSSNAKIYHPCETPTLKLCISLNTQWDRYCFLTETSIYLRHLLKLRLSAFHFISMTYNDILICTLKQCVLLSIKSRHSWCLRVCSLSEVIEKIRQQGNHIWVFFFLTLFALLFIRVCLLCKLYLICFPLFCSYPSIILLQCFYLSAFVSWNSLKPRLSWRGYGVKMSTALRTWPPPPLSMCNSVPGLTSYTALLNPGNLLYSSSV